MYTTALCWLWIGIIIGVSFIATPAKFLAPSLSLAEALDVGRATFSVFRWIEFGLFFMLIFTIAISNIKLPNTLWPVLFFLTLALLINYAWLQPLLDSRVQLIIDGHAIPASNMHKLYIFVEFIKLTMLVGAAYLTRNPLQYSI